MKHLLVVTTDTKKEVIDLDTTSHLDLTFCTVNNEDKKMSNVTIGNYNTSSLKESLMKFFREKSA